jgi:hypothetical protein
VSARRLRSAGVALFLLAPLAHADMSTDQCIKSNAEGQALRLDGKLAAARTQLETCVDPSCPKLVREDCAARLGALLRAQPAIAFDVKDAMGAAVPGLSISVDGQPVATDRPLRLDPGAHAFTFAARGWRNVKRRFELKEGETDRHESIVLEVAPAEPLLPHAPAEESTSGALGMQRTVGLVVGATGIVGLALGAVFGAMTFAAVSQQKSDCASAAICPNQSGALSEHSSAVAFGAVSTVAFIAGGALVAGGLLVVLLAPKRHAVALRPMMGPGLGGLFVGGGF